MKSSYAAATARGSVVLGVALLCACSSGEPSQAASTPPFQPAGSEGASSAPGGLEPQLPGENAPGESTPGTNPAAPGAGPALPGAPATTPEAQMPTSFVPPAPVAAPPTAVPLCGAKLRAQSALIADFESYDGTVEPVQFTFRFGSAPNAGVLAGVFAFDDNTAANRRFGILAGRSGGWGVSQQIVQANAWGGGMGLWFDCVDASAYSGISFWVRGSTVPGTFSLTAGFLRTSSVNAADARGGGTCTGGAELCKSPSAEGLPLTLDWTLIELPWSAFTSGLVEGAAYVPTGDELMGLTFGLPIGWGADPSFVDNPNDMTDMPTFLPMPSDIIFQIDDINFIPR